MDDRKRFRVEHPRYGSVRVAAVDRLRAVTGAAREWGVRWTEIARECTVTEEGGEEAWQD